MEPDEVDSLGEVYDFGSIMHYARNTFSRLACDDFFHFYFPGETFLSMHTVFSALPPVHTGHKTATLRQLLAKGVELLSSGDFLGDIQRTSLLL